MESTRMMEQHIERLELLLTTTDATNEAMLEWLHDELEYWKQELEEALNV